MSSHSIDRGRNSPLALPLLHNQSERIANCNTKSVDHDIASIGLRLVPEVDLYEKNVNTIIILLSVDDNFNIVDAVTWENFATIIGNW